MKILIDIGHPAHVHYFKEFIKIMEKRDHEFLVIAKNRNITYALLDHYEIPYVMRKDFPSSLMGKLINIPITDYFVIKHAISFKPDLMFGISGTHVAHAGFLLSIPSIVIDDTEHATLAHLSYKSFASVILTPECFYKDLGAKHHYFNSYTELFYLHSNYFKPNPSVLECLGLKDGEAYAIVRFVAWNASHDVNEDGLSEADKIRVIDHLSQKMHVFISSENELPEKLKKYQFNIPPEQMHDALYYATIYVGEGGTTASEAAILGTPAVYVNNLTMGYINDEKEAGLLFQTTSFKKIIEFIDQILSTGKGVYLELCDRLIKHKIDPTEFLVWFMENYPDSASKIKQSTTYSKEIA
jgi:uncharacterized protein